MAKTKGKEFKNRSRASKKAWRKRRWKARREKIMSWMKDRYEGLKGFGKTKTWRWLRALALLAILGLFVWVMVRNLDLNLRAFNNNREAAAEQALENDDDAQVVLIASLQEELDDLQEQFDVLTDETQQEEESSELDDQQGDQEDDELIDLSAPESEKTPSGFPAEDSKAEQVSWVSERAVVQVNKIEDEPAGFYVNSKEAGPQMAECPVGAACTWHLADGRIVYFRGQGEVFSILAGTWRFEDQYNETVCVMAKNALKNSYDEQFNLEFLGDVTDLCPNLTAEGDPALGEETILMSELTGVPLIRLSNEPGAWDFNSKGVGLQSFTCIEGAVCTVHTADDDIIFVIGNGQEFSAKAVTIRLMKHYEETVCQIWQKEQTNGATAHESVTCQQ